MPIRPENVARYPANWPEIRAAILVRAGDRCEWCGVHNHEHGFRDDSGRWWTGANPISGRLLTRVRVVLTIAHLDHTPENCDPENLRALCQRCHNTYDLPERRRGMKRRAQIRQEAMDL